MAVKEIVYLCDNQRSFKNVADEGRVLCLLSYLVFTCFAYASYLPYLYDRTVSTVYRTHFGLCRYLDT
jgi:hypothetical protein